MANLIQFSDLQATYFSASTADKLNAFDLVPIIRPEATGSGYINLKARFDKFVPDSSSYSLNSISSSYANTASYALNATVTSVDSASFAQQARSASYSETASYALKSLISDTASYVASIEFATTASYALNAFGDADITQSIYQSLPIGGIMMFASSSIPIGWLECNGAAITQSAPYAELYAVMSNENISASFGYKCLNDVGTTRNGAGEYFKLPDLRGEFVRGWDNSRGVDSGRSFASTQSYEIQSHNHSGGISGPAGGSSAKVEGMHSGAPGSDNYIPTETGTTGSIETRPRNVALVYCIRYANLEDYSLITANSYIAGDVNGSINNTTVRKIQNISVATTTPVTGDTLIYNGSQWAPGSNAAGTGIQMITPVTIYSSLLNPAMTKDATQPGLGSYNSINLSGYGLPAAARLVYLQVRGYVYGPNSGSPARIVVRASSVSPYYDLASAFGAGGGDYVHILSTVFIPYLATPIQWQQAVNSIQGQYNISLIGYVI